MSFGGQGMLPFLMANNADNAAVGDACQVSKTRMQRFVYAWWDTEDGPLEIIPPEDSMWYKGVAPSWFASLPCVCNC
jgi:hypothetical protein